ncbi:hypothetical protein PU560_06665, partial [Georgenia sp. 10Sc9-8]|nr:hypothetical protein [Georgenia halotolerans]
MTEQPHEWSGTEDAPSTSDGPTPASDLDGTPRGSASPHPDTEGTAPAEDTTAPEAAPQAPSPEQP